MPLLDVTEVLDDPLFNEPMIVIRNQEVIGEDGRVTLVKTTFTPFGVVTAGKPDPLLRTSDYEAAKNTITVNTRFFLIDATTGMTNYQPDIVNWQGRDYLVRKSYDYSKYGAGFIHAECELIATSEVSPA